MHIDEVIFLAVEDVFAMHVRVLEEFSSEDEGGFLDEGLVVSAVQAPRGGYYVSLAAMAAAYAHGIAMNHGFVNGNKRTALTAAGTFLEVNGFPVDVDTPEWTERLKLCTKGKVSREDLARCFAIEMGGDPVKLEF